MAASGAVNGTLDFTAETAQAVTFDTAMSSSTYRVVLSQGDFIPLRVTNKTTAGFTVEVGSTYTGSIGFDVFAHEIDANVHQLNRVQGTFTVLRISRSVC